MATPLRRAGSRAEEAGYSTRWGAARGSRVEEAATLRERVTRVGPSTVPNRRPPRGGPLRQVGASNMRVIGRRYLRKKGAVLMRVIAIMVDATCNDKPPSGSAGVGAPGYALADQREAAACGGGSCLLLPAFLPVDSAGRSTFTRFHPPGARRCPGAGRCKSEQRCRLQRLKSHGRRDRSLHHFVSPGGGASRPEKSARNELGGGEAAGRSALGTCSRAARR